MTSDAERDELAERLRTFADVALRPDPAAMARIRGALTAAAARQAPTEAALTQRVALSAAVLPNARVTAPPEAVVLASAAGAAVTTSRLSRVPLAARLFRNRAPADRARVRPSRSHLAPRLAAAFVVLALVLVGGGGAVAASTPGTPFYPARLWLERAALPASGSARLSGDLSLLQARLTEAQAAASSDNAKALSAALSAYEDTARDAEHNVVDAADQARLDSVLIGHEAVLASLADAAQSRHDGDNALIRAAIGRATTAIDRIRAAGAGTPAEPGTGQGQGSASHGPSAGAPGNSGNQGGNGDPQGSGASKNPKSSHSPAPPSNPAASPSHHTPAPKDTASPKPGKTPVPKAASSADAIASDASLNASVDAPSSTARGNSAR